MTALEHLSNYGRKRKRPEGAKRVRFSFYTTIRDAERIANEKRRVDPEGRVSISDFLAQAVFSVFFHEKTKFFDRRMG